MIRDFIHKPVLRAADVLETATNDVERVFGSHEGERCDRWRHYLPVYDRHLSPFRGSAVRFLEIGVANGGSFEIWRRYLGERAVLHGLDVNMSAEAATSLSGVGATLHVGDQKDRAILDSIVQAVGGLLDVVIDDGSHVSSDQIATFETLYPKLAPGGVYICEDTHTSYFGNGLGRSGTFVSYAKRKVDALHSWYVDDGAGLSDAFALATSSVLFYDSMVVFERARADKGEPRRMVTGRDA